MIWYLFSWLVSRVADHLLKLFMRNILSLLMRYIYNAPDYQQRRQESTPAEVDIRVMANDINLLKKCILEQSEALKRIEASQNALKRIVVWLQMGLIALTLAFITFFVWFATSPPHPHFRGGGRSIFTKHETFVKLFYYYCVLNFGVPLSSGMMMIKCTFCIVYISKFRYGMAGAGRPLGFEPVALGSCLSAFVLYEIISLTNNKNAFFRRNVV